MKLEDLGYNEKFELYRTENNLCDFDIARVISEHKERYTVSTEKGEYDAEITGNLRFTAKSREDFPAVGDWVALSIYDSEFSIIHHILPRFSVIARKSVGHIGEKQLIATNIDCAFLVQAVDRDFNINRLERYLTICYASNVKPIIVLTKTDLVADEKVQEIVQKLCQRINDVPVIAVSNLSKNGYGNLEKALENGKTYCMLGSSGVGKSTLVNNLKGKSTMKTDAISQSTNKGRHVTTHRELIVLDSGGILIDNPGMREVGIADNSDGFDLTFDKIMAFSRNCKYGDCTHTREDGCAVKKAVDEGEIDKNSYENYLKMEKEKAHFESSLAEKRKKDKDFGKMVKNFKKQQSRLKKY